MKKSFKLFFKVLICSLCFFALSTPTGAKNLDYEKTYDEDFNESFVIMVPNNSNKAVTSIEFRFTLVNFYYNMLDPRYREYKSKIIRVSIPPKSKTDCNSYQWN